MENVNEATCDSCGRVYMAVSRRHYCSHCDKYFHICPSCSDAQAKCRFCGIALKKKREPVITRSARKRVLQRVG